jgi:ribonucleoside-diphosphate reductase alpha chain
LRRSTSQRAVTRNDIHRAVVEALERSGEEAAADLIVEDAARHLTSEPEVDARAIHGAVLAALLRHGADRAARWHCLYPLIRSDRLADSDESVDLSFSVNALRILAQRYLRRNELGEAVETPDGMLRRVAHAVAAADADLGGDPAVIADDFYDLMKERVFLPNSPTLMNAGTSMGQLSACFVIPVPDSIPGIFDALHAMARVHQSGGGTGFSFSALRPAGSIVRSTGGAASGPVSFMRIFDIATDVITQGGRRRGANMGVLRVDHPDVLEFIRCKRNPGAFRNFNLSVGVTDLFMEALGRGDDFALIDPVSGAEAGRLRAAELFDEIVESAWQTGDPGMVFLDRINAHHPVAGRGRIEATNPCGEQPLLPYESCNLGSLNLARLVRPGDHIGEGALDEERLRRAARLAVRFLDNVIEVNRYPLPEVTDATLATRKIGLGVMGFAEALVRCGVPYDSREGLRFARRVMSIIADEARRASAELGESRGPFPAIGDSVWPGRGWPTLRNATVTTIAPTGTISLIADTSSGIEPYFALSLVRNVMEGVRLPEVNGLLVRASEERGIDFGRLAAPLARSGSLRTIEEAPDELKRLFGTALDIAPRWHVRMQAAFQAHTDNAVSKTVNLPRDARRDDVAGIFRLAYEAGCHGITVFRYGSKGEQVLDIGGLDDASVPLTASPEFTGECRFCAT